MWDNPTSMRPTLRRLFAVAVGVGLLLVGFAAGWLVHAAGSPGASGGSHTLSVIAAGSLAPAPLLPALASAFANETPGVAAPLSAQLYEGSDAAATALAGGGQPYDLFVSADFRVIPQHLEPPVSTAAHWEVVFAADPLVLAFDPGVAALAGLNATNWYTKLVSPGVLLGAPNASVDPLGVNTIVALELEDSAQHLGGRLYGHFFSGGEGGFAIPTPAVRVVPENNAATALSTQVVDAYFLYRSYAVADRLSFVPLDPTLDFGGTSAAEVAEYASASTTVLAGSGTVVVKGAPVLFALTVPTTALNTALGIAFAAFLLSNSTASVWAADGFSPLAPAYTDAPGSVPAALTGSPADGLAPLPSYLAALLG